MVLLVSRSHRQSTELFRIVTDFYRELGNPMLKRQTVEELELTNFSRIATAGCSPMAVRVKFGESQDWRVTSSDRVLL